MIFKEDPQFLGYTKKVHGVHGGIVVHADFDLLELEEWPAFTFLELDSGLVPFALRSDDCFIKDNANMVLFLVGIEEPELAQNYIGKGVYFPKTLLDPMREAAETSTNYVGYQVILTSRDQLGEVTDFMDIPENPIWVIALEGEEIMVPATEAYLVELDEEKKQMTLNLPEELMRLNES